MNDYKWLMQLADSIKNGGVCDKTNAEKILNLEKKLSFYVHETPPSQPGGVGVYVKRLVQKSKVRKG